MSMRICITDRDQEILKHIEEFKSITIEQCRKIFCNKQKRGDVIARRRLTKLLNNKKLKVSRDETTNQNVYYMERKLSFHDLLVMDYYAELINHGSNVLYFEREKEWMDGKIKSDAFCCHYINDEIFFDIVEINKTHFPELDKYKKLYESKEAQQFCSEIYKRFGGDSRYLVPRFILIDNVQHKNDPFISNEVCVIQLDFKLNGFVKIFLSQR